MKVIYSVQTKIKYNAQSTPRTDTDLSIAALL